MDRQSPAARRRQGWPSQAVWLFAGGQRNRRDVAQIDAARVGRVAIVIGRLDVPRTLRLAALEADLRGLAVGERIDAEDVGTPFVLAVGRNVEGDDGVAGIVDQSK